MPSIVVTRAAPIVTRSTSWALSAKVTVATSTSELSGVNTTSELPTATQSEPLRFTHVKWSAFSGKCAKLNRVCTSCAEYMM